MRLPKQLETLEIWQLCIAFGILAILPFLGALQAEFVFDDQNAVLDNPMVTGDFNFFSVFQRDFWGREPSNTIGSYRPLAVLSFRLDQAVGGGSPWAFHLSNLLLHGAACAALFAYLAHRFDKGLAAIATTLFAVHAVHTENVLAIVGRADVLATILVLAALAIARGTSRRAWLAGPIFFAALLSKEIAVAALAILLADTILGLDPGARANRRSQIISLACMLLALAAYLLLRHLVMGLIEAPVQIQGNPLLGASAPERIYTASALVTRSASLMLLPWTLIVDYSTPAILPESSLLDAKVLFGLVLSLGLAVSMWALRKRLPVIAWGAAIMAASYIPVSNLFVLVPTIFAERLLYLPSMGFCVVLAGLLCAARQKQRWPLALTLLFYGFVVFNMVRASVRTSEWQTDRDLFSAAVDTAPISLLSRLQMGHIERRAGNHEAAAYQFNQAIVLAPNYGNSYTQLGITLDLMNDPEQAHRLLQRAVQITPQCAECVNGIVTFYLKYGRFDAAVIEINKLERAAPRESDTVSQLRARLQDVRNRANDH